MALLAKVTMRKVVLLPIWLLADSCERPYSLLIHDAHAKVHIESCATAKQLQMLSPAVPLANQ